MCVRWLLSLACFLAIIPIKVQAVESPNVLLITLDGVRADRTGFLGGRMHLTPNLDRFAQDAIIFERAYAQAPSTWPSDAGILTGTYPQLHRVIQFGVALPDTAAYLPDLLHAHGYHTAAFLASDLLDPWGSFARGFDSYDSGLRSDKRIAASLLGMSAPRRTPALQVINHVLGWLQQNERAPFFLWVHLDDANVPYGSCGPSSSLSYDHAISCSDEAIGNLIEALRTRKLYDGALIIVAGNHGESLGAHGEDAHGVFLYDESIHVPLLVKLPVRQFAGQHNASPVQLVDVAPSILEVARLAVPPAMLGQSLLRAAKNPAANRPAYARTEYASRNFGWSALESWRSGNYLLIRAPQPRLYDLLKDHDGTNNLAHSNQAVFATLATQLESFDRTMAGNSSSAPGNSSGLSSSELQKLASLGYVGLERPSTTSGFDVSGIDPNDKIADVNSTDKAIVLLREGQPGKSSEILEKVLANNPGAYLPLYQLALAEIAQKHFARAVGLLHQAIGLSPDSCMAHYAMGVALLQQGEWETAVVHLEIAAAHLPQVAESHRLLADAYTHVGRQDDARRERAKAASLP
jgi:choline-sulfatase